MADCESNFSITKDVCKELSKILNLSPSHIRSFASILELAEVHRALEDKIENNSNQLRIAIPFTCDLYVSLDESNNIKVDNIVLDSRLENNIIDALKDNKSPLIIEAEKSLVNRIKEKYDSLI